MRCERVRVWLASVLLLAWAARSHGGITVPLISAAAPFPTEASPDAGVPGAKGNGQCIVPAVRGPSLSVLLRRCRPCRARALRVCACGRPAQDLYPYQSRCDMPECDEAGCRYWNCTNYQIQVSYKVSPNTKAHLTQARWAAFISRREEAAGRREAPPARRG